MTKPSFALVVSVVALLVATACQGGDDGPAVTPPAPTLHERCEASCTAGGENPCAGLPFDTPACTSACETKLAGKSDDCGACYLGLAGLRGTSCSCTTVDVGLFEGDLSCQECTYIGNARSCSTQLNDKCTSNTGSCQGFQDARLDSAYCAERCDLPVNDTADVCAQNCVLPTDEEHGCASAGTDVVDACNAACVEATRGKGKDCQTCYFNQSYWLGTTCVCDDGGQDCVQCNLAANRGGVTRACAELDVSCIEQPQCQGWQSHEDLCTACGGLGPDAGTTPDAGAPDASIN